MKKIYSVFFIVLLLFCKDVAAREINEHLEKAYSYYQNGKLNQSLLEAQLAVEDELSKLDGYLLIANIYMIKNDFKNAFSYAKKIEQINPQFKGYNAVLGGIYYSKKDYDNAIKCFKKEIEITGADSNIYMSLGCVYSEKKDMVNAKKYLEMALEKDPNNQLVLVALSKIAEGKGLDDVINYNVADEGSWFKMMAEKKRRYLRSDECMNSLKEKNTRGEATENDRCVLGLQYLYRGMQKEALECFNKILLDNPKNFTAYNCIGLVRFMNKDFKAAIDNYKKAIAIEDNVESRIYLSNCYKIMGEYGLAAVELERAIIIDPVKTDIYEILLSIYSDSKNIDRGYEISKKFIEIEPTSAKANYFMGYFCFYKGDRGKSIDYIEKTISLNPEMAEAYCMRGAIHLEQEETLKGITQLKKALDIDENNVDAHALLGTIYAKTGKRELAIEEFKEVIALKPNMISILHFLAILYLNKGDLDMSIDMCKRIIELKPENEDAHLLMGKMLIMKRLLLPAIAEFNKVIDINSKNHVAYYNLACIYAIQGNEQKTINNLKKSIDLGFNDIDVMKKSKHFEQFNNNKEFRELISRIKGTQYLTKG